MSFYRPFLFLNQVELHIFKAVEDKTKKIVAYIVLWAFKYVLFDDNSVWEKDPASTSPKAAQSPERSFRDFRTAFCKQEKGDKRVLTMCQALHTHFLSPCSRCNCLYFIKEGNKTRRVRNVSLLAGPGCEPKLLTLFFSLHMLDLWVLGIIFIFFSPFFKDWAHRFWRARRQKQNYSYSLIFFVQSLHLWHGKMQGFLPSRAFPMYTTFLSPSWGQSQAPFPSSLAARHSHVTQDSGQSVRRKAACSSHFWPIQILHTKPSPLFPWRPDSEDGGGTEGLGPGFQITAKGRVPTPRAWSYVTWERNKLFLH